MRKGLNLLSIVCLLFIFGAEARAANFYEDKFFGFEIALPDGWKPIFSVSQDEAKRAGSEVTYVERRTSRGVLAYLFVAEKGESSDSVVHPSVKIAAHPSFDRRVRDPVTILRLISKHAAKAFKEFKMIEEPDSQALGEIDGAHARYTYSHAPKNGETPISVLCDIWLVAHGPYFVQIAATMRADAPPETLNETLAMMRTFKQMR